MRTPGKQDNSYNSALEQGAVTGSASAMPCVHFPCLSLLQEALGAGPQKAKAEEK